MDPRFISAEQVRQISGVSEEDVSDADLNAIIVDIEYQIEKYYNTSFTPQIEIDFLDGNGKNSILTDRSPLLKVFSLKVDDQDIDVKNIFFSMSGRIRIHETDKSVFENKKDSVVIKYLYGKLEKDKVTQTLTTADAIAGNNIILNVSSETDFADNDYIMIEGEDKNFEAAKITAVGTNQITVDSLTKDHISGSIINKIIINPTMLRLMKISSGLATVARVVGETADDITGYSLEGLQVQKGEPFTQWRETALQLQRQRDEILKKVPPTPGIVV
jgi:hypothetical protein